jgi:hypothetical protein
VEEQLDGVDLMVLSRASAAANVKPSSAPCDPPRREEKSEPAHTGDRALYSHKVGTPGWGRREERAVAYPLRAPGRGDRGYADGVPLTWLHLDRSDPDVFALLFTANDSMVSCFNSRGATQQSVERETREDYRERSQPA